MNKTIERRPAHIVILDKIGAITERANSLFKEARPDDNQSAMLMGALLVQVQTLKEMDIPEKEVQKVLERLREIHRNCSPEVTRRLFLSAVLLALDIVPPAAGKDTTTIDIGGDINVFA